MLQTHDSWGDAASALNKEVKNLIKTLHQAEKGRASANGFSTTSDYWATQLDYHRLKLVGACKNILKEEKKKPSSGFTKEVKIPLEFKGKQKLSQQELLEREISFLFHTTEQMGSVLSSAYNPDMLATGVKKPHYSATITEQLKSGIQKVQRAARNVGWTLHEQHGIESEIVTLGAQAPVRHP